MKKTEPKSTAKKIDIKPGLVIQTKSGGGKGAAVAQKIGTVEHLEGTNYIKLKQKGSPEGKFHWIPMGWVQKTDEKTVYLNKTHEQVRRNLMSMLPKDGPVTREY